MNEQKLRLSVSLDLDNLWSYLKTHGEPAWESLPSYLDELVEIVLDRLARHGLTITFFVVGQDAALDRNRAALRAIASAGHEIGNHSFHHEPWLHLWSRSRIEEELTTAEAAIEQATGVRPRGFRGPGFSFSPDTLSVLMERQYQYDASTFPTILGPLARAYYFWGSPLTGEAKVERSRLFGGVRDGFRPIRPYAWKIGSQRLVEIPVTTMPCLRFPMHLSYLVYFATRSRALSLAYFRSCLALCRTMSLSPSMLLHPLDFLGNDRVTSLPFFPGMNVSTAFKLDFFDECASLMTEHFEPVTMAEHAAAVARELGADDGTEVVFGAAGSDQRTEFSIAAGKGPLP